MSNTYQVPISDVGNVPTNTIAARSAAGTGALQSLTPTQLKALIGISTVGSSGDYDDLINKPSLGTAAAADSTDFAASSHSHAWSAITSKPTTLAGFGITDGVPYTGASADVDLGSNDLSAATLNSSVIRSASIGLTLYDNADNPLVGMSASLSQWGTPIQFLDTVTLAADPTLDLHAATKQYVDDNAGGSGVPYTGATGTVDLGVHSLFTPLVSNGASGTTEIGNATGGVDVLGDLKIDKASAVLDIGATGTGSPKLRLRGVDVMNFYSGGAQFTNSVLFGPTLNDPSAKAVLKTNLSSSVDGFAARSATSASGSPMFLELSRAGTDYFIVDGYTGDIYSRGTVTADACAFRSGASDPTTGDLPDGFGTRWHNTTLSEVRDWVNVGGVLKKSAAYT